MSVWKRSILLFVVFTSLVLSAVPASAVTVTDDIDDVMYFEFDPITGDEESLTVVSRPNIDITSVSYTITGSEITLTMTVKGTIEDSNLIGYIIYFGMINETYNSLDKHYRASYGNGAGYYSYSTSGSGRPSMEPGDFGELTDPVSGNTFTATFEIAHFDPTFEIWGHTMEQTIDPMSSDSPVDYWGDLTSNFFDLFPSEDDEDDVDEDEPDIDDEDEDTTGDDEDIILPDGDDTGGDGNGGTPGFEILAFIVALAIAFIIFRRKKL